MQGVTTAIVAFIFVCLVYPHVVKHRPQFYVAIGLVLLGILLDAIGHVDAQEHGGFIRLARWVANPCHEDGAKLSSARHLRTNVSHSGCLPVK